MTTPQQELLALVAERSYRAGLFTLASGKESDFVKHLPQMQQISQSVNSGNNQAALDMYYQLPESLQNDKTLLLFRIRATQALNNVDHLRFGQMVGGLGSLLDTDPPYVHVSVLHAGVGVR